MKKFTSTQVLGGGFVIILALLVFSAFEASRLQGAGDEQQGLAYRHFIRQDDAITAIRRTVWLGGIYSRDFFSIAIPPGARSSPPKWPSWSAAESNRSSSCAPPLPRSSPN